MISRIILISAILLTFSGPPEIPSPIRPPSMTAAANSDQAAQPGPTAAGLADLGTATTFFLPAVFNSRPPGWHTYLDTKVECLANINSLAMISAYEGWAVGERYVFHIYDGIFQPVEIPANDVFNAIVMVSPTEGWAVGCYGTIIHYLDGTWQVVSSSTNADLLSLSMLHRLRVGRWEMVRVPFFCITKMGFGS